MAKVFPEWNSVTVAMMGNWGSLTFLITVLPMCLFIQRFGVRAGTVLCAFVIFIGPLLRWITFNTIFFTP